MELAKTKRADGKYTKCYKTTAAEILGLTPYMFDKLGLEPVGRVPNPRGRGYAYLYDRTTIENLVGSDQVTALLDSKPKPADYASRFKKRYNSAQAALDDVAHAMFNLNRYAKYDRCAARNRSAIYSLKNRLIKRFYQAGYCDVAHTHQMILKRQICFSCDGTGTWWDEIFSSAEICRRCDGTGTFKPEKVITFYVFHFTINEKKYAWHQAADNVDFEVVVTETDSQNLDKAEEKPLSMPLAKLTEGKALIAWFLDEVEQWN